ncbi:MAG: hypothetical protein HYZ01_00715 [Ignavibacteriales bacterium]|nr:hypothetical protein [Ignavibacteriales bacterium]
MNEASKNLLMTTVKEWAKFTGDREKLGAIAGEVAALTRKCVQESLALLKTQNIEVDAESPEAMKVLGVPVHIDPVIDATFPNVKVSVVLKCGGATRTILINPNLSISAGGAMVTYDQLKKGIPPPFETNAAEFVKDAFLYVARTGGKE